MLRCVPCTDVHTSYPLEPLAGRRHWVLATEVLELGKVSKAFLQRQAGDVGLRVWMKD